MNVIPSSPRNNKEHEPSSERDMKPGRASAGLRVLGGLGLFALFIGLAWWAFRPAPPPRIVEARRDTLTLRDGLLYRPGEAQPFTGSMTEYYPDGALQSRSAVSNGLLHGVSEGWHPNGQRQVLEHFVAGVAHGSRTKWRPDGQKLSEAEVVEGRLEGMFRRWHENGALAEEIPMKAGEPDGVARAFHPDGSLKAEARLQAGQVLAQRFANAAATGRTADTALPMP